jgi:hypothetical protein
MECPIYFTWLKGRVQGSTTYLRRYLPYLRREERLSKACCAALIEQKRNVAVRFEAISICSIVSILMAESVSKLSRNMDDETSRGKSWISRQRVWCCSRIARFKATDKGHDEVEIRLAITS